MQNWYIHTHLKRAFTTVRHLQFDKILNVENYHSCSRRCIKKFADTVRI